MPTDKDYEILHIKKYPNRRFYDTTRSCHVTLQDVHELIQRSFQVRITDSRNGDDITNSILLQILLDKDQLKLDVFPPTILHLMLRSDHQVLRTYVERFFGPYAQMMSASQKQFDMFLKQSTGTGLTTPMDWANSMLQAMTNMPTPFAPAPDVEEEPPTGANAPIDEVGESMQSLRDEVAALHERIETITADHSNIDSK